MRRRDFIKLVGGSAVAWPLALRAQQSGQLRRIGVLIPLARDNSEGQAFLQGLQTPCSDEFDVKVIEQTGDIVSGDGNCLTTPLGANFKCGDHIGDCDPQSARISLSRKGAATGMGARFDAARRANHFNRNQNLR
jgi:hypothetical protein